MEIPSKYDHSSVSDKWYAYWIEHKLFKSVPDQRTPYTVVIPPPNVTGVLHMGHMLNNTIQDLLVRRARMKGFNALWVPGTDHASIATEAKVVQKLRSEGIKKSDLSREEFMKHAWDWTNKHGGIILDQLKKLGASCDWDRTRFTMDRKYYDSVIDSFIDLYKKGKIYRGERMINWDPSALTALSNEEVIYKEVSSKLYFVKYRIKDSEDFVTIATTRPETILGDTAICVNPKDSRYQKLHGKKALVPLLNREIPIIADDYVEMDFGTGCLKVTPAHDPNDFVLGQKHGLDVINIMNDNATISKAAKIYTGLDRFTAREKIIEDIRAAGQLEKIEEHINKVGFSERSDAIVEPRISLQWFVDMKELSKPALDHVLNDDIRFYPQKFKNSYRNWMENINDWCISRQLWWGHQIPAWYAPDGSFVVAKTKKEALDEFRKKDTAVSENEIRQDEDVLDTWFSSWLWPISVFDGFYTKEEVSYYYPTNDLVTAPEIMFFWVARMIIAGYEYMGELPFRNVYYTGIVRDKQGRKMSKSLGNSPDPLKLMEQYGADGVRVGMLLASPAGNDLLFDESLCEQGRNFSNKIWNAFRLVKGWEEKADTSLQQPPSAVVAIEWMKSKFSHTLAELNDDYDKFRISEALMATYKLVWDDFCSWYLEMIKPSFGNAIDKKTLEDTIDIFENILKVLHPFMPFISEDIWHYLRERKSPSESICLAQWPTVITPNEELLISFDIFSKIVTGIRTIRKENNIPNKNKVQLMVRNNGITQTIFNPSIAHLCNTNPVEEVKEKPGNSFTFIVNGNEYFIPFTENVNVEDERKKISTELQYTRGFLQSVEKKLNNERFVSNAPQPVLDGERKKQSDALSKIKLLEDKLASLN
ncbi:MAG: valine--tRNA ligase [Crocinitomicaceae bacterium]|nr:valine--tRNA ligase [Crocinitomicaceae bacterium]